MRGLHTLPIYLREPALSFFRFSASFLLPCPTPFRSTLLSLGRPFIVFLFLQRSCNTPTFNDLSLSQGAGSGPILASATCRFRAPLTFPDHFTVAVRMCKIRESSFYQQFSIISDKQNKVVFDTEARVVTFDYSSQKKIPIPVQVVNAIINDSIIKQAGAAEIDIDLTSEDI